MSIFDSLPAGMLAGKAPPGYRARSRVQVEGKTLEELDQLVEAAGGWKGSQVLQSNAVGRGRQLGRATTVYWYVLPDSAFDEG